MEGSAMNNDEKDTRIRGVQPAVQIAARQLRQAMTPAEQRLWQALRSQKLSGLKFRRQHPIGQFVLDFFCPACALAVELDGSVHDRQQEQDAARTKHLTAYGYRVLRFRNTEVLTDLPKVLQQIADAADEYGEK
jgi:very-short-patch-repair endonuclease